MSDNNTGYRNTGNHNAGDYNAGNHNAGDYNAGSRNTGNWNAGSRNTGYYNAGNWNTGNWNTGNWNAGHHNTGNCNTGYHNTGNWNAADNHVGSFNTINAEKIYCFNKLIDKSEWDNAYIPSWIFAPIPITWVSSVETTGGYLRVNDLKEEWRKAYEGASEEDIQAVRDLPAFDYDVFEEITGLDLRPVSATASCEGREVEIDGVVYVLKKKENEDD